MKILIPVLEDKLKPIGGPYGYLYNLKTGLEQIGNKSVVFFPTQYGRKEKKHGKLGLLMWKYFKLVQIIVPLSQYNTPLNFADYNILHFHSSLDLYMYRKNLKKYQGLVLLTSHSPKIWHKEFSEQFKIIGCLVEKIVERVDIYAFERCDYLVFPCPEAEEPYFHTWNKYEMYSKSKKYKYLLTGIARCERKYSKQYIREKYNIPQTAKVVCYVGRHNLVKGYDLIKKAFSYGLKEDGVYVLIAGKEEPIKGIENDSQWIECGWTKDPYSIICASDLFILPNRETYFDLVALEVLSLGKRIIMSNTGGNRFFEKYQNSGIVFFESENYIDLYKKIDYTLNENDENDNYELYKSYFTLNVFANNYVKLIQEILEQQCKEDI